MAIFTVSTGAAVVLPLTVRDSLGNLIAVADARYQIRNSAGVVVRPFPASGTDFAATSLGIYEATITSPTSVDAFHVEYEATIAGTLTPGEADVLITTAAPSSNIIGTVS